MTGADIARGERAAGLTRSALRQRPIRRVVGVVRGPAPAIAFMRRRRRSTERG